MSTIHDVMSAPVRQIFSRVTITYSDRENDTSILYNASSTGRYTYTADLADYVETTPYKWFSLHDNNLSGTYHPLPSNKEVSVGWWGTTLSDGSGVFTTPPYVEISFSVRTLRVIQISSDPTQGVYPVDFDIVAYNSGGTVLQTIPITGNTQYAVEYDITPINNVAKFRIYIKKINLPNFTARIMELGAPTREIYQNGDLVSLDLLEEVGYSTGALPIGNVSSNELDLSLYNKDRKFDLDNTSSPLYGLVRRNRKVDVELGAYVDSVLTWYPFGTYWTNSWDIPEDALYANLTARDRLEGMRLTEFSNHQVYTNWNLRDLFQLVLRDAGLTDSEFNLDSALAAITIPYAWFDNASHRDALQRLAGCGLIQVYCDKSGVVQVNLDFDGIAPVADISDDTNLFSAKYPLAVSEQVNYIEVTAVPQAVQAAQTVLAVTSPVSVPGGGSTTFTFQFAKAPVVSISAPSIVATGGVTLQSYTLYSWGIAMQFLNPTGSVQSVTSISITGVTIAPSPSQIVFASDANQIKEDGKIKQTLEHDFIQSATYAQTLADAILLTFKQSRYDVTLNNRGDIALELGDMVRVISGGSTTNYYIYRQNVRWDGSLSVTTECKLPQG